MMLAVSLVAATVVGVIGYLSGRASLQASAIDQLTTIRELRTGELERVFATIQTGVQLDSRNLSAQNASRVLNEGFAAAQELELTPEQEAELEAYHAEVFVPQLEERSGGSYSPSAFIPDSAAGRYLQYHYSAKVTDFDEALLVMDAGDGSEWSAAHARYHDYFQRLIDTLSYEDVLLLDLDGNVVYTAYSGVDLGTNLETGPFRDSLLADAYREVVRSNSVQTIVTTDFERYAPSLNVPTLWAVSPVGNSTSITGVLAAQIPIETINGIMTGDERWREQGLGATGEVYLAGATTA